MAASDSDGPSPARFPTTQWSRVIAEGASVALADIDIDMAERTAAELVSAGGQAIAVRCDVADEEQVDAAVAVTATSSAVSTS